MTDPKSLRNKSSQLEQLINKPYKYGFSTDIDSESLPKGLNKKIIELISNKKNDPDYLRNFRLNSYTKWKTMSEPKWSNLHYKSINYNDIVYYSTPKLKKN